MSQVQFTEANRWAPVTYARSQMISNGLGLAPAVIALPWVLKLGIPLLVGAGIVAASGALVKSAVPSSPIELSRIPTAAILGGAGVAAYYGSDLLPKGLKPVAYILAVGGVASSIYWLFSGNPQDPDLPPSKPRNSLPESPDAILQALKIEFDPAQPHTGRRLRTVAMEQDYRFSVFNRSSIPIGFYAGLLVLDNNLKVMYRTPPPDKKGNPAYERQEINVEPGSDGDGWRPVTLKHPALGLWDLGGATVGIEIFRYRDDANPIMESASIPIAYSLIG